MRRLDAHRTWLVYQGVDSFAMALGWTVAAVFFVTELEMSPLTLILTGTAMEVAYFLFEVPTGIVADTYSRRTSIVIAMFVMGLSFVATGLAPGVAVVLIATAPNATARKERGGMLQRVQARIELGPGGLGVRGTW